MPSKATKSSPFVIFSTASSKKEAEKLAALLIRTRAAACVNVLGPMTSFFRWKGKIDRAREALLVIKTDFSKFRTVKKLIAAHHSYEVPEVIGWRIDAASKSYLSWLSESVR